MSHQNINNIVENNGIELVFPLDDIVPKRDKHTRNIKNEQQKYTYTRMHHLKYLLDKIDKNSGVPEHIIDKIKKELGDETPTYNKVKKIIMKNHLMKYYDSATAITNQLLEPPENLVKKINKKKILEKAKEVTNVIENMNETSSNVNTFSHSYLLYKINEIIDPDNNPIDNPVKSEDKLSKHDKIWKEICGKLGYEFVQSNL